MYSIFHIILNNHINIFIYIKIIHKLHYYIHNLISLFLFYSFCTIYNLFFNLMFHINDIVINKFINFLCIFSLLIINLIFNLLYCHFNSIIILVYILFLFKIHNFCAKFRCHANFKNFVFEISIVAK